MADQYTVDFNAREDEVITSNFSSLQALFESSQTFYARDNNTTLSTICHQDIRNDPPAGRNDPPAGADADYCKVSKRCS